MERLTSDYTKVFIREAATLMSVSKDTLRQHYNQLFDRLQPYEVAFENSDGEVSPVVDVLNDAHDLGYQAALNYLKKVDWDTAEQITNGNREIEQLQKENTDLKELLRLAVSANREYGECECCKYEAKDDTPCEEADYNCMYCGEECACRDCRESSNWSWQHADRAREVGVEV